MQLTGLSLAITNILGGRLNPLSWFAAGEQGAWYDPSDLTTLFQESSGVTPAALEYPVGLMRDKSGRNNHAFQATSANRPILSARVNLLTSTEAIASAPWAIRSTGTIVPTNNYAIAPNGQMTATLLNKTSSTDAQWQQVFTSVVGCIYSGSIFIQKTLTNNVVEIGVRYAYLPTSGDVYYDIDTLTGLTYMRAGTGTIAVSSVGSYWAVIVTGTTSSGTPVDSALSIRPTIGTVLGVYDVTATGSCVVWGADLRPTNSGALLPPYQRVNTASDYDSVGFPLYLKANGTSSAMSTNSIDFTSTDKMTVVTGIRKLSDAAGSIFMELSADYNANNGSFGYVVPRSVSYNEPLYASKGTSLVTVGNATNPAAAPVNWILSGQSSISTPSALSRINRFNYASSVSSQGTGAYGNYPLYLFTRSATLPTVAYNFYGAIIRGAQSDTASVTQTEQYMAQKTGITF